MTIIQGCLFMDEESQVQRGRHLHEVRLTQLEEGWAEATTPSTPSRLSLACRSHMVLVLLCPSVHSLTSGVAHASQREGRLQKAEVKPRIGGMLALLSLGIGLSNKVWVTWSNTTSLATVAPDSRSCDLLFLTVSSLSFELTVSSFSVCFSLSLSTSFSFSSYLLYSEPSVPLSVTTSLVVPMSTVESPFSLLCIQRPGEVRLFIL